MAWGARLDPADGAHRGLCGHEPGGASGGGRGLWPLHQPPHRLWRAGMSSWSSGGWRARLTAAGWAAPVLLAVAAGGRSGPPRCPLPEDEVGSSLKRWWLRRIRPRRDADALAAQIRRAARLLEGCSDDSPAPSPDLGLGALLEVLLWALLGPAGGGGPCCWSAGAATAAGQAGGAAGREAAEAGDLVPPPLPDDPPALAPRLWAAGRRDEALAALPAAP